MFRQYMLHIFKTNSADIEEINRALAEHIVALLRIVLPTSKRNIRELNTPRAIEIASNMLKKAEQILKDPSNYDIHIETDKREQL